MAKYFLFNKPWGVVTARRDDRFPTVLDFFPPELRDILHPVGRLDKETEGLLLLTDDGMLDKYLLRPEHHIEKQYFFWAFGTPKTEDLEKASCGIQLPGSNHITLPTQIVTTEQKVLADISDSIPPPYKEKVMKNPTVPVFSGMITLTEGKRHQVRRMLKSVGHAIIYLKRVSIGNLTLEHGPQRGKYRPLTENDLKVLGYHK